MPFGNLPEWAMGVMLVSVRIAMLFIAAPPLASVRVPPMARVILILSLAAGLVGAAPQFHVSLDVVSLGAAVLHEAVVGGAIAAGLFSAFGAFMFAGRLLDFQIGFGIANVLDLATRNNAPLLGSLLSMAATVFFFAIDGHLALIRLLGLSLAKLPPGTGLASLDVGALIAQFGTCFSFGVILVAPVILCLFLVDIGMSFMSRTMPQMNVFVMSMSLKAMLGLAILAISVPFAGAAIHRVFEAMFGSWSRVLQ